MARGVNKAIIVGHLGANPDVRYTPAGAAVATVNIATNEQWKDKETGEKRERTEWHRIVFFGRLAEIVEQYLTKGQQVYVEGRIQTRKWQDDSGNDRYTTEIVANEMQMLGGRHDDSVEPRPQKAPPTPSEDPKPQPQQSQQSQPVSVSTKKDDFEDDDIPF